MFTSLLSLWSNYFNEKRMAKQLHHNTEKQFSKTLLDSHEEFNKQFNCLGQDIATSKVLTLSQVTTLRDSSERFQKLKKNLQDTLRNIERLEYALKQYQVQSNNVNDYNSEAHINKLLYQTPVNKKAYKKLRKQLTNKYHFLEKLNKKYKKQKAITTYNLDNCIEKISAKKEEKLQTFFKNEIIILEKLHHEYQENEKKITNYYSSLATKENKNKMKDIPLNISHYLNNPLQFNINELKERQKQLKTKTFEHREKISIKINRLLKWYEKIKQTGNQQFKRFSWLASTCDSILNFWAIQEKYNELVDLNHDKIPRYFSTSFSRTIFYTSQQLKNHQAVDIALDNDTTLLYKEIQNLIEQKDELELAIPQDYKA